MDIWLGQVGSGTQIHAYDPGIAPNNGTFWVIPIPEDSVTLGDDEEGDEHTEPSAARLHLADIHLRDATTNGNSIMLDLGVGGDPSKAHPGEVTSLDIRWNPLDRIHDAQNGFQGKFTETRATTEWSAKTGDFSYVSDPGTTSVNIFSLLGRERNGVFFR
ncbi:MAG: hypothetical protein DMG54_01585 [Acidobacteria bacterium]|nr:MAG: hypothetical protein DMG54_01585 [Acidobacteriota bacterium]